MSETTSKRYISQIKIGGQSYDIKDTEARLIMSNGVHYVGITSTPITDGSTNATVSIGSNSYTAANGDIVLQEFTSNGASIHREFIWNGTKWDEFGSTGAIGSLAFANEASGDATHTHTCVAHTTVAATVIQGKAAGTIKIPGFVQGATTTFDTADFVTGYAAPTSAAFKVKKIRQAGGDFEYHPQKLGTTTISTASIYGVSNSTESINKTWALDYSNDTSVFEKVSVVPSYSLDGAKYLGTTTIPEVNSTMSDAVTSIAFETAAVATSLSTSAIAVSSSTFYSVSPTTVNVNSVTSTISTIDAYTALTTTTFTTSEVKGVQSTTLSATKLGDLAQDTRLYSMKPTKIESSDTDYSLDLSAITVSAVTNIAQPATSSSTFVTGLTTGNPVISGNTNKVAAPITTSTIAVAQSPESTTIYGIAKDDAAKSIITSVEIDGTENAYIGNTPTTNKFATLYGDDASIIVASGTLSDTATTGLQNDTDKLYTSITAATAVYVIKDATVTAGDEKASKLAVPHKLTGSDTATVAVKSATPTSVLISDSKIDVGTSLSPDTTITEKLAKAGEDVYVAYADGNNNTNDTINLLTGLGAPTTAKSVAAGTETTFAVTAALTTAALDVQFEGTTSGIEVKVPAHTHDIADTDLTVTVGPA